MMVRGVVEDPHNLSSTLLRLVKVNLRPRGTMVRCRWLTVPIAHCIRNRGATL